MIPRTPQRLASARVAAAILRHPALFTVLLLAAYMLPLREVVDHLRGQPSSDQSVGDLVRQVADLALAVAVIAATGWWRAVGFTWPRAWRSRTLLIGPGIFFGLIALLQLTDLHIQNPGWFARVTATNVSTGFAEEMVFRGLLLYILLRVWTPRLGRGAILPAVLVSSALWASLHLANLTVWPLDRVLNQVGYVFFFGLFLAAWRLRVNSIWPGIVAHTAIDTLGGYGGASAFTWSGAIATDIPTVLLGLWGVWLIRGSVRARGGANPSGLSVAAAAAPTAPVAPVPVGASGLGRAIKVRTRRPLDVGPDGGLRGAHPRAVRGRLDAPPRRELCRRAHGLHLATRALPPPGPVARVVGFWRKTCIPYGYCPARDKMVGEEAGRQRWRRSGSGPATGPTSPSGTPRVSNRPSAFGTTPGTSPWSRLIARSTT